MPNILFLNFAHKLTFIFLGYESPFIAILFSKQMTLIFGGFIVSFPIIFIGTKLFSKCEGLKKMFTEVWDGFWWNGPLRTFTELYIEI